MDYSQFKGKPFQVISKLGVRYTGIFDSISQEDQTVCLSEVYNHGTEDRPTERKLAGSDVTLGWVRFHTESISSLDIVNDHRPKGLQEQQPVDPALASVGAPPPHALPSKPRAPAAPAVPDAAFDFSQGTSALQADRDARKPEAAPARPQAAYDKSSFWDNLTTDNARVPRSEERGRNMDTFGEAGGQAGGFRGRGRGRGAPRGGYRGLS